MSVFLVTGVSGGLGQAVASQLLSEKAKVFGISRRPNKNLMALENYQSILLNIQDYDALRAVFESVVRDCGHIDGIVHAAASSGPLGRVEDLLPSEWADALGTNLLGTFNVISNAARLFRLAKRGNFVALSGGGATNPMPRMTAYAASKSGVVRLVESVARDFDDLANVTFNSVAPGIMKTAMIEEVIEAGPEIVGNSYYEKINEFKTKGIDSLPKAVELIHFLVTNQSHGISGKLISAVWDDWKNLVNDNDYKLDLNLHTLRRAIHG